MAKLKGPLWSFSATGKFAGKVIFQKQHGRKVVKSYALTPVFITDKQNAHKSVISSVVSAWRSLSADDKTKWSEYALNTFGKTYSGYNAFWVVNVPRVSQSLPVLTVPPGYETEPQIIQDGLVMWWRFEEGEGESATDKIGGLVGTLHNNNWVEGKAGGACDYNGTDSYIEVPDDALLDFSSEMSCFAWVKASALGSTMAVIGRYGYYGLWVNSSGSIRATIWSIYGSTYKDSTGNISAGSWYYVGWTYNKNDAENKNLRVYINGEEKGYKAYTYDLKSGTYPLFFGVWSTSHNLPFSGVIDEVHFYNRALSPEEVSQNYNAFS